MKRICPRCQTELSNNCYLDDKATHHSYFQLIIHNQFSKEKHQLKSCYCTKCGYVEMYVDFEPEKKVSQITENLDELFVTVQKYADDYNQRIDKENKAKQKIIDEKKRIDNFKRRQKLHQERLKKRKK